MVMPVLVEKSQRILLTGANGMVGSAICRAFINKKNKGASNQIILFTPTRQELDLTIFSEVEKWFKVHKPNIVFFQHRPHVTKSVIKQIRKDFNFVRLIIAHNGFLIDADEFSETDIILCAFPSYLKNYKKKHNNVYLFYHYFNENITNKISVKKKDIDISFIGNSGYLLPNHYNRFYLLDFLLTNTNIKCWIDENHFFNNSIKNKIINLFKNIIFYQPSILIKFEKYFHKIFSEVYEEKIILKNLNELKVNYKLSEKFINRCFKPVYGLNMYSILFRSKISINSHMLKSNKEVGNMRLFEATGAGSCVLTDDGNNLKDLFEINKEIITYKNKYDCIDKIKYFGKNFNEANEIARNGRQKTLKNHTSKNRADEINEIIIKNI